jgi:prolyl-tRNA synthetase
MQDNRALQAGTSHHLGQNFSRQFDLKFQTEAGGEEYAWNTSWGVSTRLVGGLVMTHGDDTGLILPPRQAPIQVVIVPIYRKDEERVLVLGASNDVASALRGAGVRVHIDARDTMKPGPKYYEWERKGVPIRIEIGPRDVAANHAMVVMRTEALADVPRKGPVGLDALPTEISARLERFQQALLDGARARREANSRRGVESMAGLRAIIESDGGFVYGGFCGDDACEERVKAETKATIRVLPSEEFRTDPTPATCLVCGKGATAEAVWARAY